MKKATDDSMCACKRFFSGRLIACIVVLVLGGWWIFGYISMCRPHPDFTIVPLSLSDFNNRFPHLSELQLPHSATNIFWADSHAGLGGRMTLYRFDAPVSDCIAYGKHLHQENLLASQQTAAPKVTDLLPLASSPAAIEKDMLAAFGLTKVDWFDAETIRSGFEGQMGSMSPNGMFWIDTDRERFYFCSMD